LKVRIRFWFVRLWRVIRAVKRKGPSWILRRASGMGPSWVRRWRVGSS